MTAKSPVIFQGFPGEPSVPTFTRKQILDRVRPPYVCKNVPTLTAYLPNLAIHYIGCPQTDTVFIVFFRESLTHFKINDSIKRLMRFVFQ